MATSNASNRTPSYPSVSELAGPDLIEQLPLEVQQLLTPGKTPDRIQHAITWAAKRDPSVMNAHRARKHAINTFEDIRLLPVDEVDAVAIHFAAKYQRRALYTGAITGLPGGFWALIAASADVQLTAIYAVRMVVDIAQAYGYDTADVEEQAHLAEVLALAAGVDSLRGVGNWLTREGLVRVLPELLPKLLVKISVQLTEEQAAKWVGRFIPGVGAIVGATIDYSFLRVTANRAIAYYHRRYMIEHGLTPALSSSVSTTPQLAPPQRSVGRLEQGNGAHITTVEGTLAASSEQVATGNIPANLRDTRVVQADVTPSQQASPQTTKRSKKQKRLSTPERLAISLSIFAFFALGITILAFYAVVMLVATGLHQLIH